MSIFDLTFSGAVLPEHSPQQVKQDLGKLLDIDDPTILDTLFSGETFILRGNLDRKTAAEYFSAISDVGGKVELVGWKKGPAVGSEFARLDQTENGKARILRMSTELALDSPLPQDAANKLWPKSAANRIRSRPDKKPSTDTETPKNADNIRTRDGQAAQLKLEVVRVELKRLQVRLRDVKTAAQKESEKLQHRIAHCKRSSQQELESIEISIAHCAERQHSTARELERSAAACEEKAREKIAALEAQAKLAAQQAKIEVDRLHGLVIAAEDAEREAMEHLARNRADIEKRADNEIQRLREKIDSVRAIADADLMENEQQLSEFSVNWQSKMAALRQEQDEIQGHAQRSIENLELQQELTNAALSEELMLLDQERAELHQRSEDEMSQLRAATKAVLQKEVDGIARAEHADVKTRLRTKKDLQRLHAVKLDLQRRETEALNQTVTARQASKQKEETQSSAS